MASPQPSERLKVFIALASVYILWSSTYLAIRIAIESIPPFMMAGLRFFISGWAVYAALRFTGVKAPEKREWAAGALVGFLLLLVGNGGVVYAEQWVASSLAALGVATVPLWTVLFFGLWGRWPSKARMGRRGPRLRRRSPLQPRRRLQGAPGWGFGHNRRHHRLVARVGVGQEGFLFQRGSWPRQSR